MADGETVERVKREVMETKDNFDISSDRNTKYDLHEQVIKPMLKIRRGERLLEIGYGGGQHLASYVGEDYTGVDSDSKVVGIAKRHAEFFGLPSDRILLGRVRDLSGVKFDKVFSVCALHEARDVETELEDMDRVLGTNGRLTIVERMCAINKSEQERRNLKGEPGLLREWFGPRGYRFDEMWFRATYWGESLTGKPDFGFYMFSCEKTR